MSGFCGGGRGIRSCLLQSNLGQQFLCFAKAFGQPLNTTHRVVFLTLSFESLLLSTEKQNGQAFSLVRFAWRRKRVRLIAERASLLAKAKRQPRDRGFGGVAACASQIAQEFLFRSNKKPDKFCRVFVAEEEGFEPPWAFTQTVFKTASL